MILWYENGSLDPDRVFVFALNYFLELRWHLRDANNENVRK